MRSLNPDQLRTLVEVVEHGSFSAAARRLHLSQPAISLQVRELESRLGVKLVERIGKRAFASPAGAELIEHAKRIGAASDQAVAAMRRYKDGWMGRVRLGAGATALTYNLPPVLRSLREKYPAIELIVSTGSTTGVVERILDNRVDIGLVTLPAEEKMLLIKPVLDDELVAILPPGESGAGLPIAAKELARYPMIMEFRRAGTARLVWDWLAAQDQLIRPAMEIDSIEAITQCVSSGLGAAIVPRVAVASADVVVRPLRPRLKRTLGVIQRIDKPDEPALRHVREALMGLKRPAGKRSAA
jgi:DNA-binding transcriptional LysR family regulator